MTNEIFEIKIRIFDYDMCAGSMFKLFNISEFLRMNDSIFKDSLVQQLVYEFYYQNLINQRRNKILFSILIEIMRSTQNEFIVL